ncbi:MAG: FAD-binding protein [Candidatus Marinimicrobia bacterium]|nr:FAD-binding protein [Candidatus Neomarinimicrobiota bacterium]
MFAELQKKIKGDILTDDLHKILYATDGSVYRELPLAIIRPRDIEDIREVVRFACQHQLPVIPRAAGTSLAGQVVGKGIIIDIHNNFNKILELNREERWVRVEPGVVLDELNMWLAPYGLFFGPETSTASRCMIGGMLGNNSCGSHSLLYGSTRDHTLEIKAILSDGSYAHFKPITKEEFSEKCFMKNLEGEIYQNIQEMLSDPENAEEIRKEYPRPEINRRNNGYALDMLLDSVLFSKSEKKFNFCKLLAGSEGTLAFSTEIKLSLVPLPPTVKGVVCAHFNSMEEIFQANLIALKFNPGAVELIDDKILNATRDSIGQRQNRFFLQGDPVGILVIEFARETEEEIYTLARNIEKAMKKEGLGYHFPLILHDDVNKVWALRKAGLGLLSNIPGLKKAEAFIEDTAVLPEDLPDYMAEYKEIMNRYHLDGVYYAHIGSGEIHLRPMLNLKDPQDVELFHTVGEAVAHLVKRYRGSMSGEHGDGRVRGEFIPIIIGEKNLKLCQQIKQTWDPYNIFNPGKIVNTPKMNTTLRYIPGSELRQIETIFDFSGTLGIHGASEKCNGSADCLKSEKIGGTMCPSYMATREEKNVTRARANVLREYLTRSPKKNPFDHKEIYEVMDLCLSCKACKSECPSSVDVAKLKAEFLQHYYDANGIPLRALIIANIPKIYFLGSLVPPMVNYFLKAKWASRLLGFTTQRSVPGVAGQTLRKWNHKNKPQGEFPQGKIYLFNDEFTNFNDPDIGIKAILLLSRLGYEVVIPRHVESGRTYLSKGLVRHARRIAIKNIMLLKDLVDENRPLVGLEPSAILAFRDEYPELVDKSLVQEARRLAGCSYLFEEFLVREIERGKISQDDFTQEPKNIKVHGHCQQKAVASTKPLVQVLSFPKNYKVVEIASGCCGMAGAFGYEKEHYEISMKIGELVLFPEVRKTDETTVISAPGTSCRHQIKDGTGRVALHPVEILYDALVADKNKRPETI